MKITLSPPICVGRRSGYYWFPTLMRLGDGALLVAAWDDLDAYTGRPMGLYNWSEDGGQTWTDPLLTRAPFSECAVLLSKGDHLLLPYRLFPEGDRAMRGTAGLVPKGKREIVSHGQTVRVTGLPRPMQMQGDKSSPDGITAGFSFNGQTFRLPDGAGGFYLTTLYGRFLNDARYSLLFAESPDGWNWQIRSFLEGKDCPLPGGEGPCEAALARLRDGRLLCVFRMDGNIENVYDPNSKTSAAPYGVVYSEDEGVTWTEPVQMNIPIRYGTDERASRRPGSVQPSLAVLPNGTLALSGSRPGLFLWLSRDGAGQEWVEIDLQAHHNQHCPTGETIETLINTSSYTEVVALAGGEGETASMTLFVVYDRLPHGWSPIPKDSPEQCSIWLVRATLSPGHTSAADHRKLLPCPTSPD